MLYTSTRLLISTNLRQKLMIDSIWNGIHKIYSPNHSYNICLLMYIVKERSLFVHALLTTWSLSCTWGKLLRATTELLKGVAKRKELRKQSLTSSFLEMLNSPNFTEGHEKLKFLVQESHIYIIYIQMGLVIRINTNRQDWNTWKDTSSIKDSRQNEHINLRNTF